MLSPERCPGLEEVEPEEVEPEEVQERREGGVAGGRSGVGHGNALSLWWT